MVPGRKPRTEWRSNPWKHYLFAEGQAVALYSRKSTGVNTLTYLLRDYQGSVDVLTSSTGAVTVRESFDPYGQRRGTAWSGAPTATHLTTINGLTRRGYTGHEMLDSTALIHMNGRVQDPLLGRFVSADPFDDRALGGQAWNRFGYVGNNPLTYRDLSGFGLTNNRPSIRPTMPECAAHPSACSSWSGVDINHQTIGIIDGETGAYTLISDDYFVYGSGGYLGLWTSGGGGGSGGTGGSAGGASGGAGRGGNAAPADNPPQAPQEQKPICEGGAPQWIDANITAAVATARTLAASVADGSAPPIGAHGVDPVTSARIAPMSNLWQIWTGPNLPRQPLA